MTYLLFKKDNAEIQHMSIKWFRKTLKSVIAHMLYYSGILPLYKKIALRNKAVVLMYHRVIGVSEKPMVFSHDGILVYEATFGRHAAYLKKAFNVITLGEFTRRMDSAEPFDDCTCMITFDDGWLDNYTNAYPILSRHGLPAVIFIAPGYIETCKGFWREEMTHLLCSSYHHGGAEWLSLLNKYGVKIFPGMPESEYIVSATSFVNGLDKYDEVGIQSVINEISQCLCTTRPEKSHDAFMEWRHAREMSGGAISFGSHGANHRILTSLSLAEAKHEIEDSKIRIEAELGKTVSAFSYPNGDFSGATSRLVENAGYALAFSTRPGHVTHLDDRYAIKRVNIHEDSSESIPLFLARILGLF